MIRIACALLVVNAALGAAEEVTFELRGGTRISAPILKETEEVVVLDLGDEVLALRRDRILRRIEGESGDGGEETGIDTSAGIYRTGRLAAAPVDELVRRFGDAVVVIETGTGLGSGFVIDGDGHVVTNYHVIEGATDVRVTIFVRGDDGYRKRELREVRIVARNPLRDLALLKLDPEELGDTPLVSVVLADERAHLEQGQAVFGIGNPLGLERSVTQGIVSSTLRTIGGLRFIQTDASINPGNSGGPLFNERGEVVAVACAGFAYFDGLAFGIPVEELVDFLDHRDAWLYDESRPENGVTYLPPPGVSDPEDTAKDDQ